MEDACVQTGASLGAEERAAAEAAAPAAEADNEGAYGGYDAGTHRGASSTKAAYG